MKTLFIPLIKKEKLNLDKLNLDKLPNTIYIVYTIQYKKIAEQAKAELEKTKKITGLSQVLGCSKLKVKEPLLLFADGSFHAENLLSQNNKVYLFDNHNVTKLSKLESRQKAKLAKFYSSDKLGILVSTKLGQYNVNSAKKAKIRLGSRKKAYLFLADNINLGELENFDIDFWINTACPGLDKDNIRLINSIEMSKTSSM